MAMLRRLWASCNHALTVESALIRRRRGVRRREWFSSQLDASETSRAYACLRGFDSLEARVMLTASPESDFEFSNGIITGYIGSSATVEIPATIGGQAVCGIGDEAFDYDFYVTSVTIPSSVTSIGKSAFEGARITSITIPNSVTSIGTRAFFDCASLTSIVIPSGVTIIAESTFSWCTSLTSVTIPSSVTSIDNGAFYAASSLQSVTIPSSVTSVGHSAFRRAASLTSVTFKGNAPIFGNDVFDSVAIGAKAYRAAALAGYGANGDIFHGLIVAGITGVPGAPTGVSAVAGNRQVNLSWTAPSSDGGAPITDYVIRYSSNNGATWTRFAEPVSALTSSTVTGLTNGVSYVFKVSAVSSAGAGTPSTKSTPVMPRTVPSTPTGVSAVPGNGQASLSWAAPSSDGGARITDYVIRYSSNNGATWTRFLDAVSSLTSSTVTGLTNGVTYVFKVSAVNRAGAGAPSTKSAPVMPVTVVQ
jgi:hypothetical protein